MNLFSEPESEIIRTLGLYQPFGSLMLNGKIETRWIQAGKKPPFPNGKYLFYTTQKKAEPSTLFEWCGPEIMHSITTALKNEPTKDLRGFAIGIGNLVSKWIMRKEDEPAAFVLHKGVVMRDKEGKDIPYVQWCLKFENVERITPYEFTLGKQGVGILPQSEILKLNSEQKVQECDTTKLHSSTKAKYIFINN